jgi:hypothetical protein
VAGERPDLPENPSKFVADVDAGSAVELLSRIMTWQQRASIPASETCFELKNKFSKYFRVENIQKNRRTEKKFSKYILNYIGSEKRSKYIQAEKNSKNIFKLKNILKIYSS